jgi:hypothetical protein
VQDFMVEFAAVFLREGPHAQRNAGEGPALRSAFLISLAGRVCAASCSIQESYIGVAPRINLGDGTSCGPFLVLGTTALFRLGTARWGRSSGAARRFVIQLWENEPCAGAWRLVHEAGGRARLARA